MQNSKQDALRKWGFEECGRQMGNAQSLKACLSKVEKWFLDDIKSRKEEYQAKIAELQKSNEGLNEGVKSLDEKISERKDRIGTINSELKELASNPKAFEIETDFNV